MVKVLKYYWKVNTDQAEIWCYGDHYKVEDGVLNIYSDEVGVITSFSRGEWFYITAASCIDGSECFFEHYVKKEKG